MPSELPPRLEIGNPSLNQLPVWQTLDNMTRSRADTVSTCCNGPSLWRPRAVRQSLPAFECGYACGRKHSAGGDSGRGYFQATIWRDRATSHMLTIPRLYTVRAIRKTSGIC
jgi:hypothetical protein